MPRKTPDLTSTISVRLTPAERGRLEDAARTDNRTASSLIRKCLREHLLASDTIHPRAAFEPSLGSVREVKPPAVDNPAPSQ
jgi:hypothetical protein